MPRRGFIPKREVLPDPVYGTVVVTKLINQIMYDGKRGCAQAVCYEAFEQVAQKTGQEAMEVFNQAIANIMPSLEVTARKRGERNMSDKLAGEIMDAANNTGNAVKRREDMHKMAEANKAFAHYRW